MQTEIGEYLILEQIGKGSFSTVYRARHKRSNFLVSIKIISKEVIQRDKLEKELNIMKALDHPFAIALFDFFENDQNYFIVMENVEGTSLHQHIKEHGAFPEWLCKHFFCQIICVLDYLHNKLKIAHRDLKLDNIMLDRNGNIRLIDFGLGNQYKGISEVLSTACGSPSMF